ncbi:hypothetical protein AKO1_003462, partial [Acrasis kona]
MIQNEQIVNELKMNHEMDKVNLNQSINLLEQELNLMKGNQESIVKKYMSEIESLKSQQQNGQLSANSVTTPPRPLYRSSSVHSPKKKNSPVNHAPLQEQAIDMKNTLGIERDLGVNISEEIKRVIQDIKDTLDKFRGQVKDLTNKQIGEVTNYNSPPDAVFRTVRCVGLILDYQEHLLRNWEGCRRVLRNDLKVLVSKYDPTTVQDSEKFIFIKESLDGLDYNLCCQKGSTPTGVLFNFCVTTVQLREQSCQLRKL